MKEPYVKRKAIHVCVVCGEKDERTIAGKIRCAKCEKKRKRNVTKVIKKPEKKKIQPMQELMENVRLADALGVSYGKFMADKYATSDIFFR